MFLSWLWKQKSDGRPNFAGATPGVVGVTESISGPTDEDLATFYVREDDAGNYDIASRHEAEFFRRRRALDEDEDDMTQTWCKLIDLVDAKLKEVKP
jgi:hypothetical protein